MTIISHRVRLSLVLNSNNILWLNYKHNFLPFLLPQGAVWQRTVSSQNYSWLFRHLIEAKSFFRRLQTYTARFHRLFFFKLRMRGLGYRVRKITNNLYRFYFTKTNYIHLHLPPKIFLYLRKRRLFFISRKKEILYQLVKHILSLHAKIPYNKRGFTYPRHLLRRKPGKKVL